MIVTALFSIAGTAAVLHFARPVWNWLNTKEPRLTSRILDLEAEAEDEFARAYDAFKPTIQAAETEVKKETSMISEALQSKLAVLGAAISNAKTEAQNQKARADGLQSQLDAANGHIADLTNQLAIEQANHADDVSAVSALADQAAQG